MKLSKQKIFELIVEKDKEAPVILDIGSYDGTDAFQISQFFDECEVHCFEPDSRSIKLFQDKNYPENINLWKVAVGSKDWTKIKLYRSERENRESWSASSSIKKPKKHLNLFTDISFAETEEVEVCTLDMWNWFHGIKEIDFIWCDVNGAEEDVIRGAAKTLGITRYLYLEFGKVELFEGQANKEKLLSLLPDFEEIGVYEENEWYGNVLLKNKKL